MGSCGPRPRWGQASTQWLRSDRESFDGPWALRDGWIIASLIVFVLGVLNGAIQLTPLAEKLGEAGEAAWTGPELADLRKRFAMLEKVDLLALGALLFLMVNKLGG